MIILAVNKWFPSPIGVIFSLIESINLFRELLKNKFPSPIGVIFSLIFKKYLRYLRLLDTFFRLLSELYSHLLINVNDEQFKIIKCFFRLLSELYSHLLFICVKK